VGLPTGHFDTLVSAECFEHNPFWVETFANMLRMTRPGGLVAFSCASTGRPEHGTARTSPNLSPLTHAQGWDYYRNLDADDFMNTFHLQGWFDYFHFLYCPRMFDLYFYGFRKGGTQEIRVEPARMQRRRNPGSGVARSPDSAALHPGYKSAHKCEDLSHK